MLPEIKKLPVFCVKMKPKIAQIKGIKVSRNGSYHINHSNKVVHLKWGVKRSLILPRSSCFKIKHVAYSPRFQMCGHWLLAGDPWTPMAEMEVSGRLDTQAPRTQDPNPQHSVPQPSAADLAPSARTRQCPEA